MRVSFICFCKPSPSLKLEETPPQVSSSSAIVDDSDDDDDHYVDAHASECVDGLLNEVREEEEEKGEILRSCLKKAALDGVRREKKKVQWLDLVGKELAEIREFESSEEDDIRYDGDQSCVCVIL